MPKARSRDGVDEDLVFRAFCRERFGEADDRGPGRGIMGILGMGLEGVDRRHVDDSSGDFKSIDVLAQWSTAGRFRQR